jgi:exodeoxyribonuclease VII small subunit
MQSRHAPDAGFFRKGCGKAETLAESDKFTGSLWAQWTLWLVPPAQPSYHGGYPQEAKLAKEPALPKEIAALSFEDALKELEGIVQQLERGQVKLDEAITAYERGALLKRHCEQKLAEAKMKVEKIVFAADGSVNSQPAPDLN